MFQRQRHLFLLTISFTTITTFLFYYKESVTVIFSKSKWRPTPEPQPSFGDPESRPIDPDNVTKVIVIASQKKDDTTWIDTLLPDWEYVRYLTDEVRSKYNVPLNKGNEAMVYLTYIIDHYHSLPDVIVFHHGERFQWHNDDPFWDSAWLLRNLQIPYILSRPYTNLRCVWTLGCPSDIKGINQPWPQYLDPNDEHLSHHLAFQYAVNFPKLLPDTPIPSHVSVPCCAQFVTLRSSIHRLSLERYQEMRKWLIDTKLDNEISGRIFEFLWHYMFGAEAFDCHDVEVCYCKLYGVCDLKGKCDGERCGDRWDWPPEGYPDGFPKKWPEEGWDGVMRTTEEVERLRRLGKADMGPKKKKEERRSR